MAKKVFQTSISKLTRTTPHALGGLLHAFTSKFNAIYGFSLELIDALPEGKHQDLQLKVMASLDSFRALLEHLQFFAKHQVVSHQEFQLGHMVDHVCRELKKQYPLLTVDVDVQKGGDLLINSDRVLWEKLLLPVIQNACESYGTQVTSKTVSKTVVLTAQRKSDHLVVSVKDQGQGIEERNLPDLFKAFFTTKGTYRLSGPGQGADPGQPVHYGIGLTLASQILDVLGGYFEVDSTPGQGTEIRIILEENLSQ